MNEGEFLPAARRRHAKLKGGMGTFRRHNLGPASLLMAILALAGCRSEEADAYGNFEADEIRVSAEVGGRLVAFAAEEGQQLAQGAVAGQIDSTTLAIQREEMIAQTGSARARTTEAEAQIGVLEAQLAAAVNEYERAGRLFRAEAATAQQLDLAEAEVRVLRERIAVARAQTASARETTGGSESRAALLTEQIRRTRIVNPRAGTVLATYAAIGEYVQPGQPLYAIADLTTLTLRAYVSGAQLSAVRLGGQVEVRYDAGADSLASVPGRVAWISPEAEFTPTPIQTRDERTEQVYAVTIEVANPVGSIKVGMPGEVDFPDRGVAAGPSALSARSAAEASRPSRAK